MLFHSGRGTGPIPYQSIMHVGQLLNHERLHLQPGGLFEVRRIDILNNCASLKSILLAKLQYVPRSTPSNTFNFDDPGRHGNRREFSPIGDISLDPASHNQDMHVRIGDSERRRYVKTGTPLIGPVVEIHAPFVHEFAAHFQVAKFDCLGGL